ncbi:hypothetical protein LX16_0664 [Stackebrandtia albiflava]|uniref:Uncharacterized protein n=1 Tax=Stackebrandtia albiflava TaxID=406432 RepID=A0A562VAQ9_9ACTN|nr:hypothetical protein [Stackebrandtia albiflava]TWJ14969.1 hypothetical protein LX16_0664 [Stackebrandtia albiflava]
MPQTRRHDSHPPVLTTEAHAAVEAAILGAAILAARAAESAAPPGEAVITPSTDPVPDTVSVPDSPAALWTSVSRTRLRVGTTAPLPAEYEGWVAPGIVISAVD